MINRKTYSRIVTSYSDAIYHYLAKQLKDKTIAEDLTQECFLKLWEKRVFLKEEVAKSWLYKTAYNKMLNYIRDNKKIDYTETYDSLQTYQFTNQIDTQDLLDQIFNLLTTEQKTLLLLRDNEGYSYQEISKIINTSESNVKNRLFKARQKFKQEVLKHDQQERRTHHG